MCASREPARIARSSSCCRRRRPRPAWRRTWLVSALCSGSIRRRGTFRSSTPAGSGAPDAINVLTRSISEIIRDLASLIEIPPEDVATGRTYATFTADEVDLKRVRIRARVDVFPPILQDSYVTAYYRGRWFWIEDTDFRSKQVFSFVIELLQLAQTTTAPSLPVVTIPSG